MKKTETKNPGTLLGHMYIQMIHWKEVGGGIRNPSLLDPDMFF